MVHYFQVNPLWKVLEMQPVPYLCLHFSVCVCLSRAAGPAAEGRPRAEAQPQRCSLSGESFRDSQ